MDARATLTALIEPESDVRLAVLFGSAARQAAGARSDLDVGVIGPATTERLSELEARLSHAVARPVDLVDLATAPPLLRFEATRDGVVLVERTPHLWSDFRARAMVDWWDWAPFARRFASAAAARLRSRTGHGAA